jgi:glycosyltransferase involved in cell wall biosynthesis
MKIALVNYRYFVTGGPERYMFNIKEILEKNGHDIIPFSVKHHKNVGTPYESFFLDSIGNGDEIYSKDYKRNLKINLQVAGRMIYSFKAKRKFKTFLAAIKPDIIYILHFQNKLSCSIIDAAHEMGVPVVQRISDFSHICPNVIFYRKEKGICEDCIEKNLMQAVKHKCVSDSYIASSIKTFSLAIMNILKIKDKIDAFVFPSTFTKQKYINSGFKSDKLYHIPTFYNTNLSEKNSIIRYDNFALFIGRIDEDKGVRTLIEAFINTNHKLIMIGSSSSEFGNQMKEYLKDKQHNIQFLGNLPFDQVKVYIQNCAFTICPSIWYENFPNTILESFAHKKAVIASNIGSLRELVIENTTGLLFTPENSEQLCIKCSYMFDNLDKSICMGENAYDYMCEKFSIEKHYDTLNKVFSLVKAKRNN